MTSFKTTITGTELCNRALDLLPAEPIPSLDPQVGGLNARTARRWYKPTVAWLLERHHWNLATVRSPLAAIANTRSTRWRYAYKMPSDAAFIFGLVGTDGVARGLVDVLGLTMFERVGDIIYSNIAVAQIDHTSYQTTEAEFSEEFANVIVLMLASRFAMPIIKKPSVAQKYQQDGNDALVLAMARNANENQPTYGNTPSETELARGVGLNADLIWRGYALNPLLGQ